MPRGIDSAGDGLGVARVGVFDNLDLECFDPGVLSELLHQPLGDRVVELFREI